MELIRLNPNGSVTRRKIRVNFALGNTDENNPVLHHNDVIVVARSWVTKVTDQTTELLSPISNVFGLYNFFDRLIPNSNSNSD